MTADRILKPGLYRVVPVRCSEHTCIHHNICGVEAGAIGLRDEEESSPVICHQYKTAFHLNVEDRKVIWVRK